MALTKEQRKEQKREYAREDYHKNKDKYKRFRATKELREYMKRYREKHKKYFQEYKRKWHIKNRNKIIKKAKKWKQDNPERNLKLEREKKKRYRSNYPEKIKAINYAHINNQRDDNCSQCNSIIDLEFHHTDYQNNKGFTLCRSCHKELHKGDIIAT